MRKNLLLTKRLLGVPEVIHMVEYEFEEIPFDECRKKGAFSTGIKITEAGKDAGTIYFKAFEGYWPDTEGYILDSKGKPENIGDWRLKLKNIYAFDGDQIKGVERLIAVSPKYKQS